MRMFRSDLAKAARSLGRSPTITVCAILCLALGIGATAALFSALKRALLEPLPIRNEERLVAVHRITPNSGPLGTWPQSGPNYLDLASTVHEIEGLAAFSTGTALIGLADGSLQASQLYVTGGFFATLGVVPQAGRLLTGDDAKADAPEVAVLSDEVWRRRFSGDPTLVGRSITIDGGPTTVIGILPADFRVPHGGDLLRAAVWSPMRLNAANAGHRRSNYLRMLGRLSPTASLASAEQEVRGLFANLVRAYPELKGEDLRVAPLRAENTRAVRTPLLLLFGAVCLVLLIAAINVAALLLARGVQRQREMAVRVALGASGWHTMRPVVLEGVLIASAGAALGVALAVAGVRTIGILAAARMPQLRGLSVDAWVLGFALALSALTAIICSVVPAWRSGQVDPQEALRAGRGAGAGRSHNRLLRALVIVEIAASLVLMIGAGLVLKGFARLLGYDPGFSAERILSVQVTVPPSRDAAASVARQFLRPAIEAIRLVPGVDAAASISAMPYVNWGNNSNVRYEGVPGNDPARMPLVEQRTVTDGFFDVTRQRLVSGRLLNAADLHRDVPDVVVVNEALAKRDFPGKDAVGQRFHRSDTTFGTIVGVVSDIRNAGPTQPPTPEMYRLYWPASRGTFSIMIRVRAGPPTAVAASVRKAILSVEPEAAITGIAAMEDVIVESLGRPRFYFSLLGTFASIALILAVAGLYGVLSYVVAQRTREMGIRSALGSTRNAIVGLVASEAALVVVAGLIVGVVGGLGATRLMAFMLYGTSPLDPQPWVAAVALMGLAAMAAALIPAWRAANVDPLVAMRNE